MRKFAITTAALLLSAGTALGGTIVVVEPEPEIYVPPAPAYSWTGAYAGVTLGGMTASHRWSFPILGDTRFDPDPRGLTGGLFVGYNWQTGGGLVLGLEADIQASNASGTEDYRDADGNLLNPLGDVEGHSRIRSTFAARIRAGLAMDRTLLYVAGGLSQAEYRLSYDRMDVELDAITARRTGWTIGAGVEHAMSSNMRLRGEIRYSVYGTAEYEATPLGTAPSASRLNTTEVRLGVAFNF